MMEPGGFDINKLYQEAKSRWLKPSEILFILQNHERCPITFEAPNKPTSGSLFLFNRRVLRYFRKDGHMWKKKKDGRTVGEGHERLKVGNVDTLNCYYAHGEPNSCFQRRSYWMLDPAFEHIVLVHYREVAEGRYISSTTSHTAPESSAFNQDTNNAQIFSLTSRSNELYERYRSSASPVSVEVSSKVVLENFEANHATNAVGTESHNSASHPELSQSLRKLAEQLSLSDDDGNSIFGEMLPPYSSTDEESQVLGTMNYDTRGSSQDLPGDNQKWQLQSASSAYDTGKKESPWKGMLDLSSNSTEMGSCRITSLFSPECVPESINCRTYALGTSGPTGDTMTHDTLLSSSGQEIFDWNQLCHGGNGTEKSTNTQLITDGALGLQRSSTSSFLLDSPIDMPNLHPSEIQKRSNYSSEISDLQARSNMMLSKENGTDWTTFMTFPIDNGTYSPDFTGMWFDQTQFYTPLAADSSLTVAQTQQFSIREISPEWAFAFQRTKVVITGDFLCDPSEYSWAVMFGDIVVPADIVQNGVLRCHTPQHGVGKDTLCVTSSNRESCSEVRGFEFRAWPNATNSTSNSGILDTGKHVQELVLLTRLMNILLCRYDSSCISRGDLGMKGEPFINTKLLDNLSEQYTEVLCLRCENQSDIVDWILEELFKDKLKQWMSSKHQENKNTNCSLTKQEQGIIHIISGLGYEWALSPILESGVGINFRDVNGWTALHWAARFGREKMVAALLAAGASAGAVTDPTTQDPVGKNPASIAAAFGHKGLAGYLAEVALTTHLSSLTMEESEISKGYAEVEAERAMESITQRSVQLFVGGTEDELSLKESLAAVRNAAQAAARIQAAFRAHSFRKRQQKNTLNQDEYGLTQDEIRGLSSKVHRSPHGPYDQKFNKAALSIQKKYRGWKGRKEFLTLRRHVVKIQAHVRGHQVRKKYKELLWAVGVIEKAVLRWRRRRVGLRGFRAKPESIDEGEDNEDIAKVFRKQKVDAALEEGLSRVLSMVESPSARQQYRRMLESYRQAKIL